MEQMPNLKYVNAYHFFSVRTLILKFPKFKYDCAAKTIGTPFVAAVLPENGRRPSPGTIVTGS